MRTLKTSVLKTTPAPLTGVWLSATSTQSQQVYSLACSLTPKHQRGRVNASDLPQVWQARAAGGESSEPCRLTIDGTTHEGEAS